MIKQIQLRGISRTPSDRLSEDGGLSESLNMYLDTAENAPAFLPDDITEKLGLPADLQADRIFIHKTANYENYIVVNGNKVTAYTAASKKPLDVLTIEEGEKINDITSVGNTLIVATTSGNAYALFKEDSYDFIGNEIPFPTIEFFDAEVKAIKKNFIGNDNFEQDIVYAYDLDIFDEDGAYVVDGYIKNIDGEQFDNAYGATFFKESFWNELDANNNHKNHYAAQLFDSVKAKWQEMISKNAEKGIFCSPFWAIYGLRLYDGSLVVSTPQLVSPGEACPIDVCGYGNWLSHNDNGGYDGFSNFLIRLNTFFRLGIHLYDFEDSKISSWSDIIKSIDVFISEDIQNMDFSSMTLTQAATAVDDTQSLATFKLNKSSDESFISTALSKSSFVKVEEFSITRDNDTYDTHTIASLRNDYVCDAKNYVSNTERFSGRELLSSQVFDMRQSSHTSENHIIFNQRLYKLGAKEILSSGPKWFCAQRFNVYLPRPLFAKFPLRATYPQGWFSNPWRSGEDVNIGGYLKNPPEITMKIAYSISEIGGSAFVYGKSIDEQNEFQVIYDRYQLNKPSVESLVFYPNTDCKFVEVEVASNDNTYRKRINMTPHPYLPCSYWYSNESLRNVVINTNDFQEFKEEQKTIDYGNRLASSPAENPFLLIKEDSYTFQSKILGAAIASTALSQGQFGQFPLYVFTEDGIWAMETAADGSFVTSKPLSREVCANPASITSIDNAVVFVTEKAVMLIQGSEVANISPFMNGRHYTPNESALSLIRKQEGFGEFENVIKDETPFMSFMKKASIAYDYAGQRLICIAEGEDYQYIFKLDTQTWHKVAFTGFDLLAPINSYPECLIQGTGKEFIISDSLLKATCDVLGLDKNYDAEDCLAIIRNERAHRIFWEDDFVPTVEEDLELLGYKLSGAGKTVQKYSLLLTDITYIPGALTDDHKRELVDLLGLKSMNDLDNLVNGNVRELALVLYPSKYETALARLRLFFNFTISSETIYYYKDIRIVDNIYAQRSTRVFSLSTLLDVNPESEDAPETAKGILITRPFDLGMPDVFKSITNIRIRGDYDKGNVKYLLQGSDDGRIFYTLSSLRGKSWKMFRIFILADLEPTERISWIDIDFEPRYNNRLR